MHIYSVAYVLIAVVVSAVTFRRIYRSGSNGGSALVIATVAGLGWMMTIPLFLARTMVEALKPVRDDGRRRCPHCGHEFEGTRRYCIACGGQIWDDVLPDR